MARDNTNFRRYGYGNGGRGELHDHEWSPAYTVMDLGDGTRFRVDGPQYGQSGRIFSWDDLKQAHPALAGDISRARQKTKSPRRYPTPKYYGKPPG